MLLSQNILFQFIKISAIIISIFLSIFTAFHSHAEEPASLNPTAEFRESPFSGKLQSCDDKGVLDEISNGFAHRETTYWASSLLIVDFDKVSEIGLRTNGLSNIPRRYCRAEGVFNDGKRRIVFYNIADSLGFIGAGSGITWCVQGTDRGHSFYQNCRGAGP